MKNETLIEQVLGIKNVRTEALYWNGKDTRKRVITDDSGTMYGVVGRNYHAEGHGDLVAKVMEWLPEGKVVSCASSGMNHTRAMLSIELPKTFEVDGQEIKTYVNITNSLDGIWKQRLTITPVRIACLNQFVLDKKSAYICLEEKHTRTGAQRFQTGIRLVEQVYNLLQGQLHLAEKLVNLPCTTATGISFIRSLAEAKIIPAKIEQVASELFEHPIRPADEGRNMWVLFNCLTDPLNRELQSKKKTESFLNIEKIGDIFTDLAVNEHQLA